MKQKFLLTLLIFLLSCSSQNHQNVRCMEFYDTPGEDWFSLEKMEQYREVINGLQNNDYALGEVKFTESKKELYSQLEQLGFSRTNTYLKENKMEKLNDMGEKIPHVIFNHPDGSVVRVKPMQDMSNKYHPYPHYVLSIKNKECGDEFECETVKLGRYGFIFPKHPGDFKAGVSKQDLSCWGDATHMRLNN